MRRVGAQLWRSDGQILREIVVREGAWPGNQVPRMNPQPIELDEAAHIYKVNGRVTPSVTEIIGAAGLYGAASDFWNEETAWRGSVVHRACQFDDEGALEESTVDPGVRGYLAGWRSFRRETGFQPRLIEWRIYNAVCGYAGTLDREGFMPGYEFLLLDLKAGLLHAAAGVQLVGYAMALPDPRKYARCAVRLKPDGKFLLRFFPLAEWAEDAAAFLGALRRYQGEQIVESWKNLRGLK